MKKILISLVIALGSLSLQPAISATPAFSAQAIAQTQLTDLSLEQIMPEFYNGQMNDAVVDDDSLNALPHVGLGAVEGEERTVAAMHPVIAYQNAASEPRYLVIIEKVQVYQDSGKVVDCHACQALADLYTFKPLDDGSYQLVSDTQKDDVFSSSWGRIQLDETAITEGMQPLGSKLVGSIFENGVSSTGTDESWWEVLHLPEDDYINVYSLGDAGGSNGGEYDEGSPLSYAYTATYQVIPNKAKYYPIKKTFEGTKPSEDYERIVPVNGTEILNFDEVEQVYK